MTFINGGLLYLLPIALLPVIIHLLNRLRYRRISWAAMEFLLASKRETVKRSRLKNLLLLAARVLAIGFLVIALARPVATSGVFASVFLGGGGTRLVIVDNSLSMSIVQSGRTNLERALECASGMAGPSSGVGRTRFAALVQPRGVVDYAGADALSSDGPSVVIRATDAAGDIRRVLSLSAREAASAGEGSIEIVIVTDLQVTDWHVEDSSGWARVREEFGSFGGSVSVRVVDVGSAEWRNAAVADVSVSDDILVPGQRVKITARIARTVDAASSSVVSLYLGGNKVSSTALEWREGETHSSCSFDVEIAEDAISGRVELSEDVLSADNKWHIVVSPCAKIPVLCVDGRPSKDALSGASGFISAALDPESETEKIPNPIVCTVIHADSNFVPREFTAVVMASVPAPGKGLLGELRTYVERGGMLIVFLGDGLDVPSYETGADFGLLPAEPVKTAKSKKEEGIPIASIDYSVPALEKFDSPDNPQIHDVRVWRWWNLKLSGEGSVKTLLGLENSSPWLVERRLGIGTVLVFASPCDGAWSSMPVNPVFLPLMHRLVLAFAAGRLPERTLTTGDRLGPSVIPVGAKEFEVTFPSGTSAVYRIEADGAACHDTLLAGAYKVRLLPDGPEGMYAVNPPQEESSDVRITQEEIKGLLGGVPAAIVRADEHGGALAREGWPIAAAAVLFFLLAEILIARTIDV